MAILLLLTVSGGGGGGAPLIITEKPWSSNKKVLVGLVRPELLLAVLLLALQCFAGASPTGEREEEYGSWSTPGPDSNKEEVYYRRSTGAPHPDAHEWQEGGGGGEEEEEGSGLVAVQVSGGRAGAEQVANRHGMMVVREVDGLAHQGYFLLRPLAQHKRSADAPALAAAPDLHWWQPLTRRKRAKRTEDPLWESQWHLHGHAFSLDVEKLWNQGTMQTTAGLTGEGVRVSVLDDGINPLHPDIAANYWAAGSWDISFNTSDPTPLDPLDRHGTRAAGTAAARANNSVCGTGVAPGAMVAGVKVLGRDPDDADEALAIGYMCDHPTEPAHVYSASWGPLDDGRRIEGPGRLMKARQEHCIKEGRGGKGSLYVWAGGNGGIFDDNMNYDGYANSRYTISVGAVNEGGGPAFYSEPGACMLAVTPSSGRRGPGIATMDLTGCTEKFGGTSASCPMAAGVVALVLQANRNLTWLDMQNLIVRTARQINPSHHDWQRNGAGRWFSHYYGFGLLDGAAAAAMGRGWVSRKEQQVVGSELLEVEAAVAERRVGKHTWAMEEKEGGGGAGGGGALAEIEHVEVWVEATVHEGVGTSALSLFSPAGTESKLLEEGLNRHTELGWTFTSVAHWGEQPNGTWTLKLSPKYGAILHRWRLRLYGPKAPLW